jgi:hypothetical protein
VHPPVADRNSDAARTMWPTEFISTRPGRVDKAVELTYLEPADKKPMAEKTWGFEAEYREMLAFVARLPDLAETPAQFPERCAQVPLRCFWRDATPEAARPDGSFFTRLFDQFMGSTPPTPEGSDADETVVAEKALSLLSDGGTRGGLPPGNT